MFGSNDDQKTPAQAGEQIPGEPAAKKSLFGWMRKKPQAPEPLDAEPQAPVPVVPTIAADAPAPAQTSAPGVDVQVSPGASPAPAQAPTGAAATPVLPSATTAPLPGPAPAPTAFEAQPAAAPFVAAAPASVTTAPIVSPSASVTAPLAAAGFTPAVSESQPSTTPRGSPQYPRTPSLDTAGVAPTRVAGEASTPGAATHVTAASAAVSAATPATELSASASASLVPGESGTPSHALPIAETIPAPAPEAKSLFGWMRKKPQVAAAPAVDPASVSASPVASVGTDAPAVSVPPAKALPTSGELEAPSTQTAAAAAPVAPALSDAVPSKPVSGEVAAVAAAAPEAASSTAPSAPGASAVPLAASELAAAKTAAADKPSVATPNAASVNARADGSPASSAAITTGNAGSAPVTGDVAGGVPVTRDAALPDAALSPAGAIVESSKLGFFSRLKQGLAKTSASLGEGMASLFLGSKIIDDDLFDEIETRLLTADVGVEATNQIIQSLTQRVARKQLTDSGALYKALQEELTALLRPVEKPLVIDAAHSPFVILVVGVNGAGKTTTIGKLAKKLQLDGKKVMLAAGDTFRAAAVEQLQVWGERNQIAVIAQHTGADSASVIFDAVQAAKSRGMDVLIADTAGRLHTKDNLMEELKKVRRVIGKLDPAAPHEVLLVLDAGTGQNAISQTKQFNQTVNLTGLALTKLDGTAKGGVIFALAKQFALPIRYIGMGEGIDDLRTFEAEPFVQALFAERERS